MQKPSASGECLLILVLLSQIGLSIAVPLVLCTYGAYWLRSRFELGGWVVIAGVIAGLLGAVGGLWRSYQMILRKGSRKDQ